MAPPQSPPLPLPASAPPRSAGAENRAPVAWPPTHLRSRLTGLLLLALAAGGLPPCLLLLWTTTPIGSGLPPVKAAVLATGLSVILGLLLRPLAERWMIHPVADLLRGIRQIESADVHQRPRRQLLEELSATGTAPEEVRALAAAFERAYGQSVRGQQEARRIRRSLDERVEQATERATARLRRLAMRDALTGLGNRRFLEAAWPGLFQAAQASETDLVCVMLDLDHFKRINDQFGHSAGDQLLVTLGQMITGHLRQDQDIAVRLGGDEFLLLMPGGTAQAALRVLENLRRHFGRYVRTHLPTMVDRVGISAGVATLQAYLDHQPPHTLAASGQDFFDQADARLYQAKHLGRGRSVAA